MNQIIKKVRAQLVDKHFLVIGDLILDEYVFGQTERISREAPIPVITEESSEWVCGGAANVAMNLKKSGCNVSLIGLVSRHDAAGKKLLELLHDAAIEVSGIVRTEERQTTCKKRVLVQGQQVFRIDTEPKKSLSDLERIQFFEQISRCITPQTTVLVSDYGQGLFDAQVIAYIIKCAALVNALVLVDPRGPTFDKYCGVDYIKPNAKEFEAMVDSFGLSKKDGLVKNAQKICTLLQLRGLVITLSEKGMHFVSATQDFLQPAIPREVFDVTGAGDTAFAFLALGFAADLSIQQVLEFANSASGIAVLHLKNYLVSLDEVEAYSNEQENTSHQSSRKIIAEWDTLQAIICKARAVGKKIVFTNGAFDLLHSGHIKVLEQAKSCGDILIVALNTDTSIKRYKSPLRPINGLQERSEIMAAIGVVDYVCSFDQNTACQILDVLRPDIMVKGGDYKAELLPEYEVVTAYGGQIYIVPFKVGYSTTSTIAKMGAQEGALASIA